MASGVDLSPITSPDDPRLAASGQEDVAGADQIAAMLAASPDDWDGSKRRDFQNDALIALTARRHGARRLDLRVALSSQVRPSPTAAERRPLAFRKHH
jgi:hypothetical protein